MKFTFKIQDYQTEAVNNTVWVFSGQPYSGGFHYRRDIGNRPLESQTTLIDYPENTEDEITETGYRNAPVELTTEQLLNNVRDLQAENNLKLSDALEQGFGCCSLDIEMETGTGKTYVYIKTMFELNKLYGWSKFIVVVPSIAIREGVKKTFEITSDHFMEHYGKKARFFIYDSGNLGQLDNFSSSASINVMIINCQAFAVSLNEDKNKTGRGGDKGARIIYSKRDEFASRRPIDVIAANNPIMIIDEPQRMGGEITQTSLKNFKPLFTLNYSATHTREHNKIYVLDALDAFNKRLVKRIKVKGFEVKNLQGSNKYLYLEDIILSSGEPKVRMELEVRYGNGIKREVRILKRGDDLYYISNEMDQYKGYAISDINAITGIVTFTNGEQLQQGVVVGDTSEDNLRRVQIRETIRSHLEKEAELYPLGIKTLSLFFIDEVAKYRRYDEEGNELLGEYGQIFEQEYASILADMRNEFSPEYLAYLDVMDIHKIHNGYFSVDNKGKAINSKVKRGADYSDDISAYDLILKDKERLLSFEEPTRFIFSHSALREGWDNPNVFQICTLKHSTSNVSRRQEVGRGLRLCVNQQGNRMDEQACGANVHKINELTVIASESYAPFVAGLQSEIVQALYDRPKTVTADYFKGKIVHLGQGTVELTEEQGKKICWELARQGYLDWNNKVTAKYREDLNAGNLAPLSDDLKPMEADIHKLIQAVYDENALNKYIGPKKPEVKVNKLNERFEKQEFQKLWKEINHKYAYTVAFDSNELIDKAVASIDAHLSVSRLRYTMITGEQRSTLTAEVLETGAGFESSRTEDTVLQSAESSQIKYDLVGKIASGTVLTRRTAATILSRIKPEKFAMYSQNPEEFIAKVIRLINEQKATVIVEHITYNIVDGSYDSSIFTAQKSTLDKAYKAEKAIQDYVFTDGIADKSVERKFAEAMDKSDVVNVYAKLPKGFYIPTPVGKYSPDWAIVFNEGKIKHIYFIAETKGSMSSMDFRATEKAKIDCAKKLFSTLSHGNIVYTQVDSFQTLLNEIMQ